MDYPGTPCQPTTALGWQGPESLQCISTLYISEAFDTLSHKIFVEKLYGLEETQRQTENWLNGQAQSVVISGTKPSWRPVTNGVPQGFIWARSLFSYTFINDLVDGAESILSKFANDYIKLWGVADTPECHTAIQGDLVKLEKSADRSLIKFNKGKAKYAPGEEQLRAGDWPVGKQFGCKGPGPGGHQPEHESSVGPCCKEGWWHPGLY